MKKLLKISALIAAMALSCAFFGCSNGNSSVDNNSFDDCTAPATEVTPSDGNWTLKITQRADGTSSEGHIKATASNGSYTYTYCSETRTADLSKKMNADELTKFNALSDDKKKQAIIERMGCPKDATITFNGNIVTIKASYSTEDELKQLQSEFDLSKLLSELPYDAIIKTNSDKTKYTIKVSSEGHTMVFYISKD